jgi:hypothetical protein
MNINIKLIVVLILNMAIYCLSETGIAQARKPIIMVVPSDVWCSQNGYMMEFENQGVTERVPDYHRALQSNPDLLMVISKINELMIDRGFPLKDLEASLRSLRIQAAEDAMLTSRSGDEIAENPIDALKRVAQADVWLQITWTVHQVGPKRSISFNMRGLDAYTDKQIAGASGTGEQSFTAETPILLQEAVISHLDNFNYQIQMHFDDMFKNGREIVMRVRVWGGWENNLDDYFGPQDKELSEIIEDWMYDNTVSGRFSTTIATENQLLFEQVRVPLFDERERAIDARSWTRNLQIYLKRNFDIDAKLMMRGLGQAQLVLGER